MSSRIWAAARQLAAELRAAVLTGRVWRRPAPACPPWCAGGHHCSAWWRTGGTHRSAPMTLDGPAGRLVVTGVQATTGARWVEVRASIRLPDQAGAPALPAEMLALSGAAPHPGR